MRAALWLGPALILVTILIPPPSDFLSLEAWRAIGLTAWMALWWMTECVPIPVTSLLPLVLAPVLGVASSNGLAGAYGHPLIYLFLGGFLLSIGMERTGLHRRVAKFSLRVVGQEARFQVAGIMGVTAFLSMWMSNTATAIMMLPIATSVIALRRSDGYEVAQFGPALLLGIAYGASIGGMGTLIGTPPNAFLAAYLMSSHGIQISFFEWMIFATPFCVILLGITWLQLARGVWREEGQAHRGLILANDTPSGPLGRGERSVLIVFVAAVIGWVFQGSISNQTGLILSDTGVAVAAGLSLFLLPMSKESDERILRWEDTRKVPWGVLLLFGGGLALAEIIQGTGLAKAIGDSFVQLEGLSGFLLVATIILVVVLLTEVTSNTATTATLLPLLTPVAVALGGEAVHFAVPIALAASCAFMMPVATPPNAIVFGAGHVAMSDFISNGIVINATSYILLIIIAAWVVPWFF